ncbi:MAG: glycosyltransferase family 39 protein [Owenweeksia sp.]
MKKVDTLLLWTILLTGGALRFWQLSDIPFTHDEFSALFRTDFASFSDLIRYGVRTDGHPAGVQVFLYYWSGVWSFSEWAIKLPFILCGMAALYLTFRIGKLWFNPTVGLISTAFLATMEYMVMYSQIARPYISGLFLVLMMFWFWSLMVLKPERSFRQWGFGFAIFAALCAYNHYFSFFLALLVGLFGFFAIPRRYLWTYTLFGILAALLCLPHLEIFMYQFGKRGVGEWLGKPEKDYLFNYINYIFQFSYGIGALVIALLTFGAITARKWPLKKILLFFAWFIIPFLTAYLYSLYVNPVLQYSVLIFGFPFFLMAIFGHLKDIGPLLKSLVVVAILGISTYTLVEKREYYKLFYNSVFEGIVKDHREVAEMYPTALSFINVREDIIDYYREKLAVKAPFADLNDFESDEALAEFLEEQHRAHDYVYLGVNSSARSTTVPVIMDYYPSLLWQHNYFAGTTYLFGKEGGKSQNTLAKLTFEDDTVSERIVKNPYIIDDTLHTRTGHSYRMDSLLEWSPGFTLGLKSLTTNPKNCIDISLNVWPDNEPNEIILTAWLEKDDSVIQWWGTELKNGRANDTVPRWKRLYHTIRLADIPEDLNDVQLKVYVWNKGLSQFYMDDLEVSIREGNPVIYGLLQDF